MRTLFCLFILSFIISCEHMGGYEPGYSEMSEIEDARAKPSPQELKYIDSLEQATGFNVSMSHVIAEGMPSSSVYYDIFLTSDSIIVDTSNFKALLKLRRNIVYQVGCKVIPDSIRNQISWINFHFDLKADTSPKSGLTVKMFFPYETYKYDDVMKQCNR